MPFWSKIYCSFVLFFPPLAEMPKDVRLPTANIHKGILMISCLSWSWLHTTSSLTYYLRMVWVGRDFWRSSCPTPMPLSGTSSVLWRRHHFFFMILPPENRYFCYTEIEIKFERPSLLLSFISNTNNYCTTNFHHRWVNSSWVNNTSEDFLQDLLFHFTFILGRPESLSSANYKQWIQA